MWVTLHAEYNMGETDETTKIKTQPMRTYMTTRVVESPRGNREDVLFIRAYSDEDAALKRQIDGTEHRDGETAHYGPLVRIPESAVAVVERVLTLAFNPSASEGKPMFLYVAESSDGGYTASTLTQPEDAIGFDDLVRMAGDVGTSHGTPGEALGAIAVGLDRVLADAAWRKRMGDPPSRKRSEPALPTNEPSER